MAKRDATVEAALPRTRIFGGKRYERAAWTNSKLTATSMSKQIRAAGSRARVQKIPGMGRPVYVVWRT